MSKRLSVIGIMLAVLLVGCKVPPTSHQPSPRGEGEACRPLADVDSLMWQRPDSAFALLQQFAASPEAGGLDEYNTHYFHLLLAELLYKNDCAQTNRPNVLQAVDYFDPRHCGLDPQSPKFSSDIAFLTARAHYINGVGYYEHDSIVEACGQYLKALEVMENYYEEKDLVGKKAKFMAYLYNRLGELFSGQYMMESAIECFAKSYWFSLIDPISPYSLSSSCYYIGLQYDKLHKKDSAYCYYRRAIELSPDTDNLFYRDLESSCALLSYQIEKNADIALQQLYKMLQLAPDEEERLTRCFVIGDIFVEEKRYDSALFYLEPVYRNTTDMTIGIQSADYLRKINDSLGNDEKADEYVRFLVGNKQSVGENKALVSKLEESYKSYSRQKLQRQAESERKKAVKKAIGVIIPIAVVLTLALIVFAKLRSKKLLKEKQKEADRAIEAERQTHRTEQAALSGRLKRSNQELRELKDQIKQLDELSAKAETAASFVDEPICRLIMERVKEGHFLSQMDCKIYKDYALDKDQLTALRKAVDSHYNQFTVRIGKAHPELTRSDLDYCCLYLLDLSDADVAALMQRAYNTVNERHNKLRKVFNEEKALSVTLRAIAEGL